MNKQHYRRVQRWRMSKNLRKRRGNLYLLEQRVKQMEDQRELAILDLENTQDLMKALEMKVDAMAKEIVQLKVEGQGTPCLLQKMWKLVHSTLSQKGNP